MDHVEASKRGLPWCVECEATESGKWNMIDGRIYCDKPACIAAGNQHEEDRRMAETDEDLERKKGMEHPTHKPETETEEAPSEESKETAREQSDANREGGHPGGDKETGR
jgi:hypothetical protein